MADVVEFAAYLDRSKRRPADQREPAIIMLFTGVRYERHADPMPPAAVGSDGAGDRPDRRSRKRV